MSLSISIPQYVVHFKSPHEIDCALIKQQSTTQPIRTCFLNLSITYSSINKLK